MSPEGSSIRTYTLTLLALLVLLALTLGAGFVNLGAELNAGVALLIACIKALLVLVFFMHLRESGRLTWVFAGAGFLMLLLLAGLTLADYVTRA